MVKTPFAGSLTVQDALVFAHQRLRAGGNTNALDVRLLVGAALQMSPEQLITQAQRRVSVDKISVLEEYLNRRLAHEPVSKITGRREFWGLPFHVSTDTLDPRPDSEILIEVCLDYIGNRDLVEAPLRILDLGTGSGCLLSALLHDLPNARGIAVDISMAALAVASKNFRALGLYTRAQGLCARWTSALKPGAFDIIVCNPPYIPTAEINNLQTDVRNFDPKIALDGGIDGFCAYRETIPQAFSALKSEGLVVFEAGIGQATEIESLMKSQASEFMNIKTRVELDLAGVPRVVAGVRQLAADNLQDKKKVGILL